LSFDFVSRDPRFNDETRAYTQFMRSGFPPPSGFTFEAMRERAEALHAKINEKFTGTFKGVAEEKKVRISGNTGEI
jgi:hypothetical protein